MTRSLRVITTAAAACLPALLLLVLSPPVVAQEEGSAPVMQVREIGLEGDGTTQIVVSVTGEGLPAVLPDESFQVTEGGEPLGDIQITPLLESGEQARVAIAILVDTSGSTDEVLDEAKAAINDFAVRLAEQQIQMLLVPFSQTARVVAGPTASAGPISQALAPLQPGGETAIYDAVVLAAERLRSMDAQANIVVFSDGGDTVSEATLDDAVDATTAVGAPLTTVILSTPELDLTTLEDLATRTGGRAVEVTSTAGLTEAFDTVAADIASQYVLTYIGEDRTSDELDIRVTVTAAGTQLTDVFTVRNTRVRPAVEVREVDPVEPGRFASDSALAVGLGAAFLSLVGLFALLASSPRSRADRLLESQLEQYVREPGSRHADPGMLANALRARGLSFLEQTPLPQQARLERRLEKARWPMSRGEFLALDIGLTVGAALIGLLLLGWLAAVVFAMIAVVAPWVVLNVRGRQRTAKFLERLPDTLQLLAGSLSAGYGLLQALDLTAREAGEPMTYEFNRALTEARLGMPLEDALDDMADRVDSVDFRWVVLAIKIQREVGGNLAQLLTTVAETLREREMLRRQIKVLSAEGKLSAIILIALPFLLAGWLTFSRPEYVSVLTQSLVGWALIWGGAFLMAVGIVWIRNMIRIEV